jgi:nitric oxide reductase NorD protein
MEEAVGKFWHRLITRAARRDYPGAAIQLVDIQWRLAPWLRALSCDPGLGIEAASRRSLDLQRSLLQRIAGSGKVWPLAWRDQGVVRLPAELAVFPKPELNIDLYRWLAALASQPETGFSNSDEQDWVSINRFAVNGLLKKYPGLNDLWSRLLAAYIPLRPSLETLTPTEQQAERYLREAICRLDIKLTDGVDSSRLAGLHPVLLWLSWSETVDETPQPVEEGDDEEETPKGGGKAKNKRHRKGEYADDPDGRTGLLAFRLESLFSWTEYIPLDRTSDDGDEKDAERASEDLDVITISRNRETQASKLKFDLDLPPAAHDDIQLGPGVPMPEWDYRKQRLVPDFCSVQPMITRQHGEVPLPENLHIRARRVRHQFEQLLPERSWLRAQPEGSELDLDAWLQGQADMKTGNFRGTNNWYKDLRPKRRDLASLLLADLSLSTDAHVDNDSKVIDAIREAVFIFNEALSAIGDRFAVQGFSSKRRSHVRVNWIKGFEEQNTARVRGRIAAMSPGYYTRMGAAIRYASQCLLTEPAERRLLLLLTDGKPNDLDIYEGRYGIEDTRHALQEASQMGIKTFCITIDEEANQYLPWLFGHNGYVYVRQIRELSEKLTAMYARLAA